MQEKLNLVQVPNINPASLSSVGAFNRKVARFQERWNIELEFNENARWRPGSYERLKEKITHSLFPNWAKPKGGNTIRKLTKVNKYNVDNFRDELIFIDDELRRFRGRKATLNEENAAIEGKKDLDAYFENLMQPVEGVNLCVEPLPWYQKNHRVAKPGQVWESSWDKMQEPVFNQDNTIAKYRGFNNDELSRRLNVYRLTTNPKRWFINVSFLLKDVKIDYRKHIDNKETSIIELPFGDIIVCFSMPVHDAILGYQAIKADLPIRTISFAHITNRTHTFQHEPVLKHPYVHTNDGFPYDLGNTCFGDFKYDIMRSLFTGQLGTTKAFLELWSKIFYLGGTSPLNHAEFHHIGMPLEWKDSEFPISNYIPTRKEQCLDLFRHYNFSNVEEANEWKAGHVDKYCNNCQLATVDICHVYKRFTQIATEMPGEILTTLAQRLVDEKENLAAVKTVTDKTKELWHALQYHNGSYAIENILSLFHVNDMGTGGVSWETLLATRDLLQRDMLAPTEQMDVKSIARCVYVIYRHMERMYWLWQIGEFNTDLYDNLSQESEKDVFDAEVKYPVADFKQMVSTYRVTNNLPKVEEFYQWINRHDLTRRNNGRQPF